MPSFVVVEKTGSLKSQKAGAVSDLYKKCGFKNAEGFSCVHTWTIDFNDIEYKLSIFGKTDGKANTENKFEFPPPIDNVLFFGSCAAVLSTENGSIGDMTPDEFTDIIDNLYGGYSDIGSDDSDEDEDEDEETRLLPKTKHGYVKDDFVVSSDAEDDDDGFIDDDEEEEVEEDEEETEKSKSKSKIKSKCKDTDADVDTDKVKVKAKDKDKGKNKVVAKPKKPKLREEPEITVYLEELTEDPYFE
jgi:hypothetical protein